MTLHPITISYFLSYECVVGALIQPEAAATTIYFIGSRHASNATGGLGKADIAASQQGAKVMNPLEHLRTISEYFVASFRSSSGEATCPTDVMSSWLRSEVGGTPVNRMIHHMLSVAEHPNGKHRNIETSRIVYLRYLIRYPKVALYVISGAQGKSSRYQGMAYPAGRAPELESLCRSEI